MRRGVASSTGSYSSERDLVTNGEWVRQKFTEKFGAEEARRVEREVEAAVMDVVYYEGNPEGAT